MKGKDKCEFLKGIRKRMAEANGIPYEPRECTYEGECTGTCPFCEKEAAELMAKIKEKGSDVVNTDTETIPTFEEVVKMYEDNNVLMGSLVNGETEYKDEYPIIEEIIQVDGGPLKGDVPSLEEAACLKATEKARRRLQEVDLKTKIERYPNFEQYLSELTWIKIEDAEVLVPKTGFYLYKCLADNHTWYDLQCLHKGERLCEFFINHPYKRDVKPIEYYYVEEADKQFVLWGLSRLES